MKLVVAGATGLVGTEIIRQSLQIQEITSIIALARRQVKIDGGVDSSKLKSVIVKDYGEYPGEVKAELSDADACIWYRFIASLLLTRAILTVSLGLSPSPLSDPVGLTSPRLSAFVKPVQWKDLRLYMRQGLRDPFASSISAPKGRPGTYQQSPESWGTIRSCA